MPNRSNARRVVFAAVALFSISMMFGGADASPITVNGAGSTFVQPIMAQWASDYAKSGHGEISYQSVGSGAGITAVEAGQVDFGATDKPLDTKELSKYGLIQFPVVVGAVVPVFNLPGIGNGGLRFSGKVLADIFQKKITRWNDKEIQALNDKVKLPDLAITVVHRSDGSGTTYNFVDFLAKSSPEWRQALGIGLTVAWPTGLAGNGNAGVSEYVQHTLGSLGYVEFAYAVQNKLTYGSVQNSYRIATTPTPETMQAAAGTVDWQQTESFAAMMTNIGGALAYPITATSFVLMPKAPADKARSDAAINFFRWVFTNGEDAATKLHFVALPYKLVTQIEAYWAKTMPPARASER